MLTISDENECGRSDRGGCDQGCANSIGSYSCFCGNRYRLNANDRTCDDFNECAREADHGCYSSDYCNNTIGGYTCSCPSDFALHADQKTCIARTSCAGVHGCSHGCAFINGNNTCQCPKGYQLGQAGQNCTDIDECLTNTTHGCQVTHNVVCVNTFGGYRCQCSNTAFYRQVGTAKCIGKHPLL